MNFAALLNNDALLDCVAAYKSANQTHHAFVYVFKVVAGQPLGGATAAALCSNLVQCCTTHTVFAAGVRRPDVDIGRLMRLVRRARNADTLRLLTKTDVADACIVRLTINEAEHDASAAVAAAAAPRGASHTDPRQRLLDYTATYGMDAADANAFADALANEDRLDTVLLSKESDGTVFILPVRQAMQGPLSEELAHLMASLPPRLLAATTVSAFDASADVAELAARLRSRDPWRMRCTLKATNDGFQGFIVRREGKVPLQSTDTARACAACAQRDGAMGSGGAVKLRCCSGCGLVLYCDPRIDRSRVAISIACAPYRSRRPAKFLSRRLTCPSHEASHARRLRTALGDGLLAPRAQQRLFPRADGGGQGRPQP